MSRSQQSKNRARDRARERYKNEPLYRLRKIAWAQEASQRIRAKKITEEIESEALKREDWLETVDPIFAAWLSGFIAGEGCFLATTYGRKTIHPRFTLGIRADDAEVLYEIVRTIEIGKVAHEVRRNGNPIAHWRLSSINECLRLIALLDRYPLRAKKHLEFEVWAWIVEEKIQRKLSTGPYSKQDQRALIEADQELRQLKRYQA